MKKAWMTSLLLLNFLMTACNEEPVEEQKEVVSDTFDPDREIKEASRGKLTQATFYKAKEGMSVDEVTETLGVELTLHTENKRSGKR